MILPNEFAETGKHGQTTTKLKKSRMFAPLLWMSARLLGYYNEWFLLQPCAGSHIKYFLKIWKSKEPKVSRVIIKLWYTTQELWKIRPKTRENSRFWTTSKLREKNENTHMVEVYGGRTLFLIIIYYKVIVYEANSPVGLGLFWRYCF